MPAGLELPRQSLVVQHETRHFFADAQALARTVEIRVQYPEDPGLSCQSPAIFLRMPVVEKPFTKGIVFTFPP